ncbi:MAG: hypothetical protein ACXVB0_11185 [Mucilaginibacter sp.]
MRKILPLLLIICVSHAFGQNKSYDYCYTNNKGTFAYSVADGKQIEVVRGVSDPSISPDGTKLAYTANLKDGGRIIKVIDINTKKKIILNTQSNNCYGPVWSPDGNYIVYNVFNTQTSTWSIALIDAGNVDQPKILTAQTGQSYSPTWMSNSQNVVVQNLNNVFVLDLSGNTISNYKISDLSKSEGPSSSDRFVFTADGNKIVFSSEVNEPGFSDGPPTAIFVYDFTTKTTLRLTPKGYYGLGVIVKNNQVLFSGGKIKSKITNVYTVDLDGKNLKVLFPDCWDISAKN